MLEKVDYGGKGMNYKVKTKNMLVTINADNVADGVEMNIRSDYVVFYTYYNDGFHKTPQRRVVARFKDDDIEFIVNKENCEVFTQITGDHIGDNTEKVGEQE